MSSKLSMSEQVAAGAEQGSRVLGCITSRDKEAIAPLCSVLVRPHLDHCLQVWSLLHIKEVDRLESLISSMAPLKRGAMGASCSLGGSTWT